ncbi:MAG TPA: glycosyltransferase [Gammaproteobacteria bacterium]
MTVAISVVIPTYRRPHLLERCLRALLQQSLHGDDYEIVVADDGAEQATEALVRLLASQQQGRGPALRYVAVQDRHGPAAARNRGWRQAQGAIIAFTDDDCVPTPDWLRNGLTVFQYGISAAWGKLSMPLPEQPTDYERDAARLQEAEFVTANCFCTRAVLEACGGFDERFTAAWREDSDLFFSLLERSVHIVHAPDAVVVHPIRPAQWGVSLAQQRKMRFDALLYKKHPRLYRARIRKLPPIEYYVIALALTVAAVAALTGHGALSAFALAAWLVLTLLLFGRRIRRTSRRLEHVLEMALTSMLIPPLAVFWRLTGAWRYRVVFL